MTKNIERILESLNNLKDLLLERQKELKRSTKSKHTFVLYAHYVDTAIKYCGTLECLLIEEEADDLKDVAEHIWEQKCNQEEIVFSHFKFGFVEGVRYKEDIVDRLID